MGSEPVATRWSRPWVIVAGVGFVVALGGLVHPWRLSYTGWAIATSVERAWWPWWPIWLLITAVIVVAAAVRDRPRSFPHPALALLGAVPAAGLPAPAANVVQGPGAALAFGGVSLVALAVAVQGQDRPDRLTRSGRVALAAVVLLVVASALPWSHSDPDVGTFAVAADQGWWLVWAIGLLGATSLATSALVARTVATSAGGIAAAAGVLVVVWWGAGVDRFDRSSPGVLLALAAGAVLLAAAVLGHRALRRQPEHDPAVTAKDPEAPAPGGRWATPLAVGAALLAWVALLAASAPWVLGPSFETRRGSTHLVAPSAWGGDLVGEVALPAVVLGFPVVVLAVAWLGRRALPAAAVIVGAAVAAAAAGPVVAGGPFTGVATAAVVLGAAAVLAGVVAAVTTSSGIARLAPVLALPALALFAVPDLGPATDGPYEVLQGGDQPLRVGAVATTTNVRSALPWTSDDLGRYPVQLDGTIAVVTSDGSYRLVDGRVMPSEPEEVRAPVDQTGDFLVEEPLVGEARALRGLRDGMVVGPREVERVAVSTDGRVAVRTLGRLAGEGGRWFETDLETFVAPIEDPDDEPSPDDPSWVPAPIVTLDVDEAAVLAGDATYLVGPEHVHLASPDGRRVPVLGGDCEASSRAVGTRVRFGGPVRARVDAGPDGSLWFAEWAPSPSDGPWGDVVYRRSPDGALEVIDHPLGEVESLEVTGDGDLLVIETDGRLLRLPDAASALSPLPPPDEGCEAADDPVTVLEVTHRRLGPGDTSASRTVPVDTAGTLVGLDPVDARRILRGDRDGTSELAAEVPMDRVLDSSFVVRPDGSVRWLERPADDPEARTRVLRGLAPDGAALPEEELELPALDGPTGILDLSEDRVLFVMWASRTRSLVLAGADGPETVELPSDVAVAPVLRDDGRAYVVSGGRLHELVSDDLVVVGFGADVADEDAEVDAATLAGELDAGVSLDELTVRADSAVAAPDGGLVVATVHGFVHLDADDRPTLLLAGDADGGDPTEDPAVRAAGAVVRSRDAAPWYVIDGQVVVRRSDRLGIDVVAAVP